MKIVSRSQQETFQAGRAFAKTLSGGDVVLLGGFLGAGKTVFSKGIAAGLGVCGDVLSPTFALMCEYPTNSGLILCHIDAYRLKDSAEAEEAGLTEMFGDRRTIAVVEWFENIADAFVETACKRVTITIQSETQREIKIFAEEAEPFLKEEYV